MLFPFQREKQNKVSSSHRGHTADFKEKYFKQILDHFNFNSLGNGTFDQRYLITGNELPHIPIHISVLSILRALCLYCRPVLEKRLRPYFLLHRQWRRHMGVCSEFWVHNRAGRSTESSGDICWTRKFNHMMTIKETSRWQNPSSRTLPVHSMVPCFNCRGTMENLFHSGRTRSIFLKWGCWQWNRLWLTMQSWSHSWKRNWELSHVPSLFSVEGGTCFCILC